MTPEQLQERTFAFALGIFGFVRPLLREPDTRHVAQQALRSAASVSANYRAACLARTSAEWVAKLGVVREEADETLFWLRFIQRAGLCGHPSGQVDSLVAEADELARIFAASYRTSVGKGWGRHRNAEPE